MAVVEVARQRDGLWLIAAVPFALFAVMALAKTIGLHWLLGFVPLVLLWLALRLPEATLARLGKFFIGFAALHVAIVAVIAALPMETWKNNKLYDGIVLTFEAEALVERLRPFADYAWASDGYSNAATLSFRSPQRFMVFGEGRLPCAAGRYRHRLACADGRNILILTKRRLPQGTSCGAPPAPTFRAIFHEVELKTVELRGVSFTVVLGRGFRYAAYRDEVLARIRSRYYALPAWLPQRACGFCERYFPDIACTR